jgi:hypothetical protein
VEKRVNVGVFFGFVEVETGVSENWEETEEK